MKHNKKYIDLNLIKAKGTGFCVPDGYFDSLESKVLSKVSHDIPTDYFDRLEDKVFKRIEEEVKHPVKVISLRQKIIRRYAPLLAAASVVLFIGLNFYNNSNTISFDSLDTTTVSSWLEDINYDASDSYVLGELLDADDISSLTASNESTLDDAQLLDYLDNTNIDNLILNN
ncbi:MAG: hypothetical protein QM486_01340 [Flavobacteriaceae bacterium]